MADGARLQRAITLPNSHLTRHPENRLVTFRSSACTPRVEAIAPNIHGEIQATPADNPHQVKLGDKPLIWICGESWGGFKDQ